jgi:hypothetical protein
MKLNRKGIIGLAATALAVIGTGAAFAATGSPAAVQAPVPTGYTASVGSIPVVLSSLGTGSSAVANAAGTLTLTVGSPAATTFAKADLKLPAGSIIPATAPVFTTNHFGTGSPREVLVTDSGDELMNNQASATASDAADASAKDWEVNLGKGWVNTLYTYADAVAQVGGFSQVVTDAYIVADGDQAAGTADTLSNVQYGNGSLTVSPVFPAVPVLSHGHAVFIAPTREDVFFVLSGAPSWVHFTIAGPGAINGHQGWVNASLGLNSGVYSGLEAHHGYAVYYQPVTGKGSTTPVPGSHIGHVFFVSDVLLAA